MATCNPWRPLKVRPGRLAGGPPKGPTVSGHRLMTAKFAPEDILTPRNPAISPQRRCFSSKSCFFFCVDGLIGANAPCLPRPDAFKQASFPCFTFVNQPRFAFQPASFHFPKQSKETLETLMICRSLSPSTYRILNTIPNRKYLFIPDVSGLINYLEFDD